MRTIRAKIFIIVAILAAGLLLLGGFSLYQILQMRTATEKTLTRLSLAISAVDDARSAQHHFKVQVQEWKNVLIRGSDKEAYEKHWNAFQAEEQKVGQRLTSLKASASKLGEEKRLDTTQIFSEMKTLSARYRAALESNDRKKADFAQATDRLVRGMDRPADKAIDELDKQAKQLCNEIENESATHLMAVATWSRNTLIISGLLVLILGIGAALRITQGIVTRIREVEHGMHQATSTRDLSIQIPVVGNDELAHMASSFNSMMLAFRSVIQQALSNAAEVSQVSGTISQSAEILSDSAAKQSDHVSSSAAAVEELTTSISSVAANADNVQNLSENSVNKTDSGSRRVAELLDEMGNIHQNVESIAATVKIFMESTNTITSMAQEVKEIAEQTNLLALNAAIEAARAGDQGRGFAVVADEVRKLAEKSAEAANQIESVTEIIQNQSGQVNSAVDGGLHSIRVSVSKADEVKLALSDARDGASQAAAGVIEIASFVKEQAVASTEIAQSMEQVAQLAEETNTTSSKTHEAARSLNQLAGDLHGVVAQFKTQ